MLGSLRGLLHLTLNASLTFFFKRFPIQLIEELLFFLFFKEDVHLGGAERVAGGQRFNE